MGRRTCVRVALYCSLVFEINDPEKRIGKLSSFCCYRRLFGPMIVFEKPQFESAPTLPVVRLGIQCCQVSVTRLGCDSPNGVRVARLCIRPWRVAELPPISASSTCGNVFSTITFRRSRFSSNNCLRFGLPSDLSHFPVFGSSV